MQSLKILVVEDFGEFRRFLCSLLQSQAEFQVEVASDGLEAVEKAEAAQPNLILLDIGLPNLNGIEVARRVHQLAPSSQILFVSAESDPDVVNEALRLGAGYVHKPRVQSDLLPAIEAIRKGEQFISRDLGLNGGADAPRRHDLLLYSADSVLLESFARFLATALEARNAAIVLASKSHRESLVQRLKAEGFGVDELTQRGTYISLDAADMLSSIMVDGVPDCVRFFEGLCGLIESAAKATKKKQPRVAICGECVGLLCAMGNTKAAVRLEKAGNDLVRKHNVDILCAYPSSGFKGGDDDFAFKNVCAEHSAVYSQ
jgi:DNA-binding NarL/FixJ family response regulator